MKNVPPDLLYHLKAGGPFIMADLYTITLTSGEVLRWADFDADVTTIPLFVSRASAGTYYGSDGLLKTAAINEARYTYNPADLSASPVALFEPAATNLAPYSEQLEGAGWLRTRLQPFGSGSVVNAITAPDGTMTADKLVEDATASNNHYTYRNHATSVANTDYVFSCYLKAAERTQAWLELRTHVPSYPSAVFNLQIGQIVSKGAGAQAGISPVGGGWYRAWMSANSLTGASTLNAYIGLAYGGLLSYSGDGASGIYAWGAQLEEGSAPSSYIKTGVSAVARAADVTTDTYVYRCDGPVLRRGNTRIVIGVEVDTLDVSICPKATDTLNGLPMLAAAAAGAFDGARLVLDRAFLNTAGKVVGTVNMFSGRFADLTIGRTEFQVRVNSDLELLAINMPFQLYQSPCVHTLYGPGCALNRETAGVTATTLSGSTVSQINSNLSAPAGRYTRGYVRFISGALAGTMRTVKQYTPGVITTLLPLPAAPAPGDLFIAYPGCDRSKATCETVLNNKIHFLGCPYIPVPETAV